MSNEFANLKQRDVKKEDDVSIEKSIDNENVIKNIKNEKSVYDKK